MQLSSLALNIQNHNIGHKKKQKEAITLINQPLEEQIVIIN